MTHYVAAKGDWDGDIGVFRGIEITCSDDVQCLAIFDPAAEDRVLDAFLAKLGGVSPADRAEPLTCATRPCRLILADLFAAVRDDPIIEPHCLLIPHFSDPEAHKSANNGQPARFAELPCDGVYIEKPYGDLQPGTLNKLKGKDVTWGKRSRAVIATGDNKRDDWARLGAHHCWIKIGEHSIEGLRQALLADEARIAYDEPREPEERIVALKVRSSLTGEEPLTMSFNPGFNALIGGRGSGKSSVLEYLRFGLARTANDLALRGGVSRERNEKLIEETLGSEGYVEIVIERGGVSETWRRTYSKRDHITLTDNAGDVRELLLDDARRRFQARAFEQKGLSTTMLDKSLAADLITGIAAAEELEERRRVDALIDTSKRDVTTALQQTVAYWEKKRTTTRATMIKTDLQSQMEANGQRLEREGADPANLETLKRGPHYNQVRSYFSNLEPELESVKNLVLGMRDAAFMKVHASVPDGFPSVEILKAEATRLQQDLNTHLSNAASVVQELDDVRKRMLLLFEEDATAFHVVHVMALQAQMAHKQLIDENQRISRELTAALEDEVTAKKAEGERQGSPAALTTARGSLSEHISTRMRILEEAAAKVAGNSSQALSARAKRDPCPEEYVNAVKGLLESAYVSDADQRARDWIAATARDGWNQVCAAILSLYERKIMAGSPPEPSEELATEIAGLFLGDVVVSARSAKRIYANLNDVTVGAILSAAPRAFIAMKYIDENQKSREFDRASPGQQASALLGSYYVRGPAL
ncbi:ATP-binding protein [Jiella pelagia]|uniref:AAA family ATPase n=1 Tax=Jiella pelagia TaxID=2986949 RepID=A0ABY7C044_9HYPH|nr:AAA family ATPase [Jiella pelagia]WAP69053.1 AAA family ATPase [Jiella pelagia]